MFVSETVGFVTASIKAFVTGIGTAVVDFFSTTVVTPDGGLTDFAKWSLIFLGVGFGSMIFKWVTNLVRR